MIEISKDNVRRLSKRYISQRASASPDIYKIDSRGTIVDKVTSEENYIVMVKANEKTKEWDEIGRRAVKGEIQYHEISNTNSGYCLSAKGLSLKDFEFIAENSSVEWGFILSSGASVGYLSTSHEENNCVVPFVEGGEVMYHSHPGYDTSPSDEDKKAADYFTKQGYSGCYIYSTKNKKYTPVK